MSGNHPPIVLLSSSSSSKSPNPSVQSVATHPNVRPPIILHQQVLQASPSSSIPFKNVVVRPYRDSIQQALTAVPTTNADVKPIILQQVVI